MGKPNLPTTALTKHRLNRPLDDIKSHLRQALKQAKIQQARQACLQRLRQKVRVTVPLRPPKTEVTYDPARVRGTPDAQLQRQGEPGLPRLPA